MSVYPQQTKQAMVMKILLLGQSNVGKTSLMNRYTQNKYQQNNLLTVGIDIHKVNKQMNGKNILLEIWDTAGQQKYKTIPTQYFRGIQGILFIYDLTDGESFVRIQDWLDKVQQNSDSSLIHMSLVGNKVDMDSKRQIKFTEAQQFAKTKRMGYIETSAKEATNVDQMFTQAINGIIRMGIKCPTKSIKLELENRNPGPEQNNNSSCCK